MALKLLSTPHGSSRASLKAIQRLLVWENGLPEEVTHLILTPDTTNVQLKDFRRLIIARRALVNHERSHARTMRRTEAWHIDVDKYMWTWFADEWDDCMIALLSSPGIYKDTLESLDNHPGLAAWQATEEILARVCSMMHAPRDDASRWFIACRELRKNPSALMDLTEKIENHWDAFEVLIGWLDAICDNHPAR